MTKHSGLGSIYLSHILTTCIWTNTQRSLETRLGLAFWYDMTVNDFLYSGFQLGSIRVVFRTGQGNTIGSQRAKLLRETR